MPARFAGALGRNAFLVATILFFGIPVVWLLLAPTKTEAQLDSLPALAFGDLGNVAEAWQHLVDYSDGILGRWVLNSLLYTGASLAIGLVTSVLAGYGLAKFRFRGRDTVLFLTLVSMIVPGAALILPLYLEMSAVHLTNTVWSVILPMSFHPFGVYLIYLYATTSVPNALIEAARIDGASEWRTMWSIFLPLARPAVIMVAFFNFVSAWNSFFLPYIMLTDPGLANLQTGLNLLIRNTGALMGANFSKLPIDQPELALAAIVSVLPILTIFIFAQRYLVAGQTAGAIKD